MFGSTWVTMDPCGSDTAEHAHGNTMRVYIRIAAHGNPHGLNIRWSADASYRCATTSEEVDNTQASIQQLKSERLSMRMSSLLYTPANLLKLHFHQQRLILYAGLHHGHHRKKRVEGGVEDGL